MSGTGRTIQSMGAGCSVSGSVPGLEPRKPEKQALHAQLALHQGSAVPSQQPPGAGTLSL